LLKYAASKQGCIELLANLNEFADVSAIVPAFNAQNSITRALASIAQQSLKPREVIVVDDGSTDGTYDAVIGMKESMNGIMLKVHRQENKGAGAARNRAIKEATSNYIAFLDADDEWLAKKIERSIAILKSRDLELVAHDFYRRTSDGEKSIVECSRHFFSDQDPYVKLFRTGYIGSITVVAKKSFILSAGGFDETLPAAQDFDLWLKLLADPKVRFEVFSEPLSLYNFSDTGITSSTDSRLKCTIRVAARHFRMLNTRHVLPMPQLWLRILAVHYEAIIAHKNHRRWDRIFAICFKLPVLLMYLTLVNQTIFTLSAKCKNN
jgi:teichuronic acid biosynthesis glycosyltransferase TuaG